MRLISPSVPHRLCSSSSLPYLLLASYFYPHSKTSSPSSSSNNKPTTPLAWKRSLHTAPPSGHVDPPDTYSHQHPRPKKLRLIRRTRPSRRYHKTSKLSASVFPAATSARNTPITTAYSTAVTTSLVDRRYNSSLASVTVLTQELLRITAYRHSSVATTRDIPIGMPPAADHLVVLVHGLWGNPSHMEYIAETLKSRYDDSRLIVHVAAKNSGNHTYDGIELGGERLAAEIEDLLEDLAEKGVRIKKFSIAGYSLGGLVSRYVIGLLYAKGFFDKIEPVNFTTFASPHLGVRTPKLGFHNHIWNVVGARTLSASGRQLFTIDRFRDTERPLLAVLADRELTFWKALSVFKNKVLYANIINDRSTNFFTSGISKFDPYADLDMVDYKYLPGYGNVLLDSDAGVQVKPAVLDEEEAVGGKPGRTLGDFIRDLPYVALYTMLVPIGFCLFLVNAGVQTYTSSKRIRLHGQEMKYYNVPLMANEVQETVDSMIDSLNRAQTADHLPSRTAGDEEDGGISPGHMASSSSPVTATRSADGGSSGDSTSEGKLRLEETMSMPEFPTLALAPYQFDMIDSLDQLGFKKFPVHIRKVKHSHAAIIVRNPKNEGFSEGKMVIKHWLDEQFEV
ncbi:hypothetical protein H072_1198 [Dactylellina haptotyla CBS 200.50]|uniref:DUF676 domain-containing protein n=1 Tax=Dactylellina haptotyla (strain CBS 200.50) TaxID=1284197 RepID=S8CAV0_DACHA|nr:hypothetical protein H072_1198 [Dactylellina haptotyla CBS 200.50]